MLRLFDFCRTVGALVPARPAAPEGAAQHHSPLAHWTRRSAMYATVRPCTKGLCFTTWVPQARCVPYACLAHLAVTWRSHGHTRQRYPSWSVSCLLCSIRAGFGMPKLNSSSAIVDLLTVLRRFLP